MQTTPLIFTKDSDAASGTCVQDRLSGDPNKRKERNFEHGGNSKVTKLRTRMRIRLGLSVFCRGDRF